MALDDLRRRLNQLDRQLLQLVAERQRIGTEIARVKRENGLPTRDFKREREVLLRARERAADLGVSPALAESLLRLLIRGSLTTQEQAQVAATGRGSGRTALVIGGGGRMGRWFADFLGSQGYAVSVADPAGAPEAVRSYEDWRAAGLDYDLIVVATPLRIANGILEHLAHERPRGVVFDIGSLKSPLKPGLKALAASGCRVTSVHPMFGPDTELLSGRHVIFVDLGSAEAMQEARELFSSTMAQQVVMSLEEHDRLIAYVLGLSHALNIAFFTALAGSGEAAPRLAQLSSTTFDAQLDVARRVAGESPELYFEIQALNEYGSEALTALHRAVQYVCDVVAARDAEAFAALMAAGRRYFVGRSGDPG
jgi:chorismate mutase/prephenate dehydrogenase